MLCKYLPYFLDMMTAEKGAAENTIDAYRRDILQFFDLFPQTATLTKEQAAQFMRSLAERCYAPKTQARKLSALKEFCRFLYSEKIIDDNPLAHISSPKQEKPLPKFLTPAQIQRLIQQAGNHKNPQLRRCGFMICLMFACGLRVSEMISLPENAINETKKQVMVKGKGSKERIVPISDTALAALREYLSDRPQFIGKNKSSPWLFPSKSAAGGHLTRGSFFKYLKLLALECDLPAALISPHTLRHSFATNLINHQADLRSVQKMLGHENIATTEIYTHITSQNLIDSVTHKHPIQNFKI